MKFEELGLLITIRNYIRIMSETTSAHTNGYAKYAQIIDKHISDIINGTDPSSFTVHHIAAQKQVSSGSSKSDGSQVLSEIELQLIKSNQLMERQIEETKVNTDILNEVLFTLKSTQQQSVPVQQKTINASDLEEPSEEVKQEVEKMVESVKETGQKLSETFNVPNVISVEIEPEQVRAPEPGDKPRKSAKNKQKPKQPTKAELDKILEENARNPGTIKTKTRTYIDEDGKEFEYSGAPVVAEISTVKRD